MRVFINSILEIIKYILIVYLFLLLLIKAFMFINIKINEVYYPNLGGYTYLKVNHRYLYPDFNMDEYLIINETNTINTNDYITYLDNNNIELYKVVSTSKSSYSCVDVEGKTYNIQKKDVLGKVVYNNSEISKIINFLNKPVVILIMILYCIFISQETFKRFS